MQKEVVSADQREENVFLGLVLWLFLAIGALIIVGPPRSFEEDGIVTLFIAILELPVAVLFVLAFVILVFGVLERVGVLIEKINRAMAQEGWL